MVSVESHPHGQHEQGPGRARPHHPGPLLLAWGAGWVAPAVQGHQVLQVPQLARHLAQDQEAAGTSHALCCIHSCKEAFKYYTSMFSQILDRQPPKNKHGLRPHPLKCLDNTGCPRKKYLLRVCLISLWLRKLQNSILYGCKEGRVLLVLSTEWPLSDTCVLRYVELKLLTQEIKKLFVKKIPFVLQ